MSNVLIVEPFYGGSHKQLIEILQSKLPNLSNASVFTLPAKKWHWKARISALQIAFQIPLDHKFEILFCSSVVSLAELCGLRPDIGQIKKKIIYFHENQLVYPIQTEKHRDFQYGYNQITSSLTADVVLFNSQFNMESFLSSITTFLNLIPDFKVKNIDHILAKKCSVLHFPINEPLLQRDVTIASTVCHIVWPHRWEHDKNPDLFFNVLFDLKVSNVPFRLSVVGERFSEEPPIFKRARDVLSDNIVDWGYLDSKDRYYELLNAADVAVSTADHEFYGVAMIEAALHGCVPVCPNRLSYPEVFRELAAVERAFFYNTERQLLKRLKSICVAISNGYRNSDTNGLHRRYLDKFLWQSPLADKYADLFTL